MECLAIIPARGGSKGILRKNVRPLAGKPLIAHTIEQAQRAQLINRLVVSTDDVEIEAVSRQYGAEVVRRPVEISGDHASSETALLHALDYLSQTEGYHPDVLAFLQCTSPLTLAEDIDGTIQALLDQDADSALAVIPFHYFLWKMEGGDALGINHDKYHRPLRQDREPQYLETGAVYVMRVAGFRQAKHRFFGKTVLYAMPAERRLEIDEPVDFKVAETLLREQQKQTQKRALPEHIAALVLDFDGVFTDNRVIVSQDGQESVICDRSDGWGIGQLKKAGLPIVILSTERNPVVQARADKLGIPCRFGLQDKGSVLKAWLAEQNIDPSQVVYIGNDENDLPCMRQVGCSVVVADAHPSILPEADLILHSAGGKGALREIYELIKEKIWLKL
jgi:YrbI family 3-deoxy-D-manno-octulosonate 8-phosphate phosphatase